MRSGAIASVGLANSRLGSSLPGYGVAIAAVAIAFALRLILAPWFEDRVTYLLFTPAIILASLWAGLRTGIFATGLSLALGGLFLHPFREDLQPEELANVVAFAFVGLGVAWLGHSRLRSQEEARRSLEAALASSRRAEKAATQYRTTFEQAPIGIAHLAPDGRILSANGHLSTLLGRSQAELLSSAIEDLLVPGDMDAASRWSGTLRPSRHAPETFEARYRKPDGRLVWGSTAVSPVHSLSGESYFVAVVEDISARRDAEGALCESENRMRRLIDGLYAFVGLLSNDGILIEANRAPLEAAGLSLDDVRGKPFWEAYWWSYDSAVQENLRHAIDRARSGETVRYDVDVRLAGGRLAIIDFQIAPLRDLSGTITHLIPSAIDITVRKRAENEVRNALERLKAVLDSSVDAIVTIDQSGTIESVNSATGRLFGYSDEELTGSNVSLLAAAPHDAMHQTYIDAYLRTGQARIIGKGREIVARRKDGTLFPAELAVGEIQLSEKRAFTGIIRDITERKEAEARRSRDEQRELALRELNHRIANLFTVILTLVRNTARFHPEAREYERALSGRLRSLSATQALLIREKSQSAGLSELVRMELAAYHEQHGSITIEGPEIRVRDSIAQGLSMIVHELATNSVKYGALSVPQGRLSIRWEITGTGDDRTLGFDWIERDGPPVKKPATQGFGSTVTTRTVKAVFGGTADADYAPEGLHYNFKAPLSSFVSAACDGDDLITGH